MKILQRYRRETDEKSFYARLGEQVTWARADMISSLTTDDSLDTLLKNESSPLNKFKKEMKIRQNHTVFISTLLPTCPVTISPIPFLPTFKPIVQIVVCGLIL